jgi:hypothetical protein
MSQQRRLEIFPWLVWSIIALIILCWSARTLAINFDKVVANNVGAQVVIYYGFAWDIVCLQGGNDRRSQWHCRPDWPYETYLAILTILLIISLVTWAALRKKWIKPLPIELTWNA